MVACPCWWQDSDTVIKDILQVVQPRCTSGTWSYDTVKYSISAGIAQVKLDDPRTGNALRHKTVSALLDICIELHQRPDVKVVVFTASGFYFSTGGAFGETPDDEAEFAPRLEPGASTFETAVAENLPIAYLLYLMCTLPQYKVASIRGTVMGAGISLVAAMDYVVAPESRTQLSFKEATRGLGACCSWQATVAKLGVMRMRRLCLLAEDVNAHQARQNKLVDHLVSGSAKDAFVEADTVALAKVALQGFWAKEVARKCSEERLRLKTTGARRRKALLQLPGLDQCPVEEFLLKVQEWHGVKPRCSVDRFTKRMWPHEAQLELVGQHIARLTLADGLGFLAALLELHATPPGQVRLVELHCDAALDMDLTAMKDALVLLRMLPQVLLGLPPQQGRGLQVLLWAQCDVVLTTEEATFEVPKMMESMADFLPPDFQGWEHGNIDAAEAKDMGIVSDVVVNKQHVLRVIEQLCEQLSECAPNAVAQSKTFIHQIGSTPMRLDVLRQLAEHIAKRTEDPEFPDSIRALWEKAHVPIYRRPGHRVVPAHLIEEEQGNEDWQEPQWQDDGSVLI